MRLSVVTTLYRSVDYIAEFHDRITKEARKHAGDDYEIILVNDGSPDNTLELAIGLTHTDPHVIVVDLSRNFGHHKAMMTGLAQAQGDLVFLIDSDLEEAPEWLSAFEARMGETGADVVFGAQERRKGRWFERVSGKLFYAAFRLLTNVEQENDIVTARLMSKRYIKALVAHQEREINIGGLWVTTGFDQEKVTVKKLSNSPTTYSFARKFGHLVNAITSFSSFPLVFIFYSGLLISITAAGYIIYLILRYLGGATPPDGFLTLAASIWFFSGLIILFMGVQGIYVAKIFTEVKQRPYTIIRQVYRGNQE